MMLPEAREVFGAFLAPLSLDEFLDQGLSGGFRAVPYEGAAARLQLLGPEPQALLAGAVHLAPQLTFHSANPLGPPPCLAGVADADDFLGRIGAFQARNYSVGSRGCGRWRRRRTGWPARWRSCCTSR